MAFSLNRHPARWWQSHVNTCDRSRVEEVVPRTSQVAPSVPSTNYPATTRDYVTSYWERSVGFLWKWPKTSTTTPSMLLSNRSDRWCLGPPAQLLPTDLLKMNNNIDRNPYSLQDVNTRISIPMSGSLVTSGLRTTKTSSSPSKTTHVRGCSFVF